MTPLAKKIMRDKECAKFRLDLMQCQFFEVTQLREMIDDLSWDVVTGKAQYFSDHLFLPSEPCFVERDEEGTRAGWLLRRISGGQIIGFYFWSHEGNLKVAFDGPHQLFWERRAAPIVHPLVLAGLPRGDGDDFFDACLPYLSTIEVAITIGIINTPRIVGRRQHMPDAKLERQLLRGRPPIGKFAVGAWTEVFLKVSEPAAEASDAFQEGHLTGERPLHFCRAHLRLRLGKIEVVRGHWRGDASLGVRRSRYVVAP